MSSATAHRSANSAQALNRIVAVNEHIKRVLRPAFLIRLLAFNAMSHARRAGDAARGFGVLSDELRQLADNLSREMTGLRRLTVGSVTSVTSLVKEHRYLAILERVPPQSDRINARLRAACDSKREVLRGRSQTLGALQQQLRQVVEDIRPMIRLGTVLARSAHIEAAYGGPFATELMQVSTEFSRIVSDIESALDALYKAAMDTET